MTRHQKGGFTAGGHLILTICAVAHACSESRYTERTGRCLGPGCVWLGVLPGAKLPRNDVTMWWNRVDIVPNVPKCPVPG